MKRRIVNMDPEEFSKLRYEGAGIETWVYLYFTFHMQCILEQTLGTEYGNTTWGSKYYYNYI